MAFRLFRRRTARSGSDRSADSPESGYFALQEPSGGMWDDPDDWDNALGAIDRATDRHVQPRRNRWKWFSRIVAAILFLFLLLVAWLAVTAPLSKSLEPIAPPQLTLLAADGTPIARNGAIVDQPVDVSRLPDHVAEAFLAIEDRRFYSHWGIDPRGIARATWANVTGGAPQGGSTITQQLAKFTFLTPERSMTRKAREMLIAFWLEGWLTKDEILSRYLSNAYFGDNVYGLRAASLHYFYRQPERLRPEQAAMLAGLVQAPSRFAPTQHYDKARKRMKMVVNAMVAAGYVTEAEARSMPAPRLDVRAIDTLPTGTYFADWALPAARKIAGTGYSRQTLTTTLDSRLQNIARRAVGRAGLGKAQVALVAMRTNGEVVAMIGGKNYATSPFNRATQAQRQPGSTFKVFVYLAALKTGMGPDGLIDNRPIETGSYRPKNGGGRYSDSISLEDGFALSSNVAAVRLFNTVGDKAVIDTARRLGVTSPLAEGDPSLALGTSTMNLLELTAAYAGIAANAFPVAPTPFAQKPKGWFDWLWNWGNSLSGRNHAAIEKLLSSAVNRGTGRAARLGAPAFGKTGTSQDYRDALFIGYSGDLVVGVWIGNDDNTPLKGISGGGLPARIWRDFMVQATGKASAPAKVKPSEPIDSDGAVIPLDIPDVENIPIGNSGVKLQIDGQEGVTIKTDVDGVPTDIRLDQQGLSVERSPEPAR